MCNWEGRLAIPIMDGMHGAVSSRDFASVETIDDKLYMTYPVAAKGLGFSSSLVLVKLLRVSCV